MLAGRDDDGREGKATVYYTAHEVNEANEYVRSQFQDVLSRKELNIKSLRVGVRMRVNVRMICQKIRVFDQLTHVVGDEFSAALLAPVDRSSGVDLPPVVEVTFGVRGRGRARGFHFFRNFLVDCCLSADQGLVALFRV